MRSSKKKRATLGFGLSVFALVAAASGAGVDALDEPAAGEGGEEVHLVFGWWGGDTRHGYTNAVADMFEEQNPGVTIDRAPTDWDSYWSRLAVESAGGTTPDIVTMHVNNLGQYATSGVLAPLDEYIESGVLDVSGLSEGFLGPGVIDGQQFMIPMGSPYMGIALNADALAEAGLDAPSPDGTWDEFIQFLTDWSEIVGPGEAPWVAQTFGDSEQHFFSWLIGQGTDPFTADGKIAFTEDDVAAWWTIWKEMIDLGVTPPQDVSSEEQTTTVEDSLLVRNRVLVAPAPSNQIATFQASAEADIQPFGLPGGPAGPGNIMLPAGLSIAAESSHPEVVAEFISFWINDPEAGVAYQADQGVPGVAAQREAMIDTGTLQETQVQVFELYGELEFSTINPLPVDASVFVETFRRIWPDVGFGTSPEDAASQLFTEVANSTELLD